MTDQQQSIQDAIQTTEKQLAQREHDAQRLRRELDAVEKQGAQGSAVRGELQQADEDIDALRQRLDELHAQTTPPTAQPPEREPLTGERGIVIGGMAWLAQEGGVSTHLRTHPHFERGEDVTRITSGMQLAVLDGPEHEEGYTWWRVRTSNGHEGWLPEEGLMGQTLG
jgi:hypothetical protein